MNEPLGIFIIAILTGLIFYWSKIPHKRIIVKVLGLLGVIATLVVMYNIAVDFLKALIPTG